MYKSVFNESEKETYRTAHEMKYCCCKLIVNFILNLFPLLTAHLPFFSLLSRLFPRDIRSTDTERAKTKERSTTENNNVLSVQATSHTHTNATE